MATYQGHNEDSSGNILLSIGNGITATVETGTTASQAYTKGSFLFFNNRLCKATSPIASGATLAIGTNLTQTSVGAELTSHLRSSDGKEFYFDVLNGKYGYYPSLPKTASQFVPFGGTCSLVGWAKGYGLNQGYGYDSNYVTCNRVKVATTGAGEVYRFDLTFKKKCSGYFASASSIVSSTNIIYAAISGASGTYTDTVYSFSASANQVLSLGGDYNYGGFEIIGS